jgi:hypothetical protein
VFEALESRQLYSVTPLATALPEAGTTTETVVTVDADGTAEKKRPPASITITKLIDKASPVLM